MPYREVPRGHPQRDRHVAAARARGRQQDRDHRKRDRRAARELGERGRCAATKSISPTSSSSCPRTRAPSRCRRAARAPSRRSRSSQKGADFRQVAAAFSEAPDALQGGVMGWRAGERLPTIFYDALKSMKPGRGERAPAQRERLPHRQAERARAAARARRAGPASVQQTRVRHILHQDQRARLRERGAQPPAHAEGAAREQGRFRRARARAFRGRERVAAAATSAGYCPGDTVPEFERAMNELKPGEISEPVQIAFRLAPDPGARARQRRTCPRSGSGSPRGRRCARASRTKPTRNGCGSCATALTSRCGSKSAERCALALQCSVNV